MILALVVLGASINVPLTIPKHRVDDQGKLVRRRRDGLRRSKLDFAHNLEKVSRQGKLA